MNRLLSDGNIVIDSFTKDKEVLIYKMSEKFPQMKDDAIIWFDGNALSGCTSFKLANGSDTTPWHIKKAILKKIPGTKDLDIKSNNVNYAFCCHGLQHFELSNVKAQAMLNKGHCFALSVVGDGSITMYDFETKYGFAGVRIFGIQEATVTLNISNFKIKDTVSGEGFYIGNTKSLPVTKFMGTINNGYIARSACEALQLQHCGGLDVYNVTCFAVNTAWINPFEPYQDTAIQWNCARGNNSLRNIIVDSFASVGINMFGGDGYGAVNKATNMLFYRGRGSGFRMDASCNTGASWFFDNIQLGGWTDEYYNKTKVSGAPYLLPQKISSDYFQINHFSSNQIAAPQYVNSGFETSNIQQWRPYWIGHLQGQNKEVKTSWKAGEVVIDTNGEYGFYRTLVDHETDLISPKDSDKFERIKWDGLYMPPDDLRIVKDFL